MASKRDGGATIHRILISHFPVLVEALGQVYNSGRQSVLRRGREDVSLVLDGHALDVISHSAEQTRRLGMHLGRLVRAGDVICLHGELGVGKTCLVQGIGRGMGIEVPINSPSFILVNEYAPPGSRLRLYHIDLYRLDKAVPEALAIGLDEYLYGAGVCVIEWADRAAEIMPADHLTVELRWIDYYKRGLVFRAAGVRSNELLAAFREQVYGQRREPAGA
jgi:tRNA threonylcarbamoyladenosine biosynthesis protein TsaE